ncbi:hypothetical protein LPJ53_002731 [Coemansia erecta]|uniref:Uncharacterized protein n=1 Tax=Coemansia erecta TaxID=147472 RepID=A0A9W7Y0T6_9FUNG|nr:hypothetical protein LPJ53_002731 [Coemansia erecta]
MGKKVRRKRQRSLFSMSSASEYSVLDSGRIGGGFDPLHLSRGSQRHRSSSGPSAWGVNGTEPPSLELLAEMIKEEIRQASGLRRALDRVGAEAEVMAQRVAGLAGEQQGRAQQDNAPRRAGKARQVHFVVPDDVRFRWLGIFQQPSESESESEDESGLEHESGAGTGIGKDTGRDSAAKAETKAADKAEPKTADKAETSTEPRVPTPTPRSPQTGRRITLGTGVRQGRVQAERQRARRAASAAAATAEAAADEGSAADTAYAGNSSVEAVYGGSRVDARASKAPAAQRTASAQSSESFEDVGQRRNSVDGSGARARLAAPSSDESSEGRRLVRRVTTTGGRGGGGGGAQPLRGDEALGGILGGTRDFFKSRLRARAPGEEGRTDSEVKSRHEGRPRVGGRQASSAEYPRTEQHPPAASAPETPTGGRQRRNTDESTYGRSSVLADDDALTPPPLPKMPPLPPTPRLPADGDADSIDYHLRRLKGERKTRRSSFMATLSSMLGRKD